MSLPGRGVLSYDLAVDLRTTNEDLSQLCDEELASLYAFVSVEVTTPQITMVVKDRRVTFINILGNLGMHS